MTDARYKYLEDVPSTLIRVSRPKTGSPCATRAPAPKCGGRQSRLPFASVVPRQPIKQVLANEFQRQDDQLAKCLSAQKNVIKKLILDQEEALNKDTAQQFNGRVKQDHNSKNEHAQELQQKDAERAKQLSDQEDAVKLQIADYEKEIKNKDLRLVELTKQVDALEKMEAEWLKQVHNLKEEHAQELQRKDAEWAKRLREQEDTVKLQIVDYEEEMKNKDLKLAELHREAQNKFSEQVAAAPQKEAEWLKKVHYLKEDHAQELQRRDAEWAKRLSAQEGAAKQQSADHEEEVKNKDLTLVELSDQVAAAAKKEAEWLKKIDDLKEEHAQELKRRDAEWAKRFSAQEDAGKELILDHQEKLKNKDMEYPELPNEWAEAEASTSERSQQKDAANKRIRDHAQEQLAQLAQKDEIIKDLNAKLDALRKTLKESTTSSSGTECGVEAEGQAEWAKQFRCVKEENVILKKKMLQMSSSIRHEMKHEQSSKEQKSMQLEDMRSGIIRVLEERTQAATERLVMRSEDHISKAWNCKQQLKSASIRKQQATDKLSLSSEELLRERQTNFLTKERLAMRSEDYLSQAWLLQEVVQKHTSFMASQNCCIENLREDLKDSKLALMAVKDVMAGKEDELAAKEDMLRHLKVASLQPTISQSKSGQSKSIKQFTRDFLQELLRGKKTELIQEGGGTQQCILSISKALCTLELKVERSPQTAMETYHIPTAEIMHVILGRDIPPQIWISSPVDERTVTIIFGPSHVEQHTCCIREASIEDSKNFANGMKVLLLALVQGLDKE